ncbi:MAG: flagellar motor stator protein MotA [Acidobacteria bacterium]|nr:flagellar motor stator protein MotA [Acidobacteriota bacterium]
MLLIIGGVVVVLASVAAGFLLENGKPLVLFQPAEFLIIVGGALGILVAGNPKRNLSRLLQAVKEMGRKSSYTRQLYLEALKVLYVLFSFGRRKGLGALASKLEKPDNCDLLAQYPEFLNDREALAFLCDSIRVAEVAGLESDELDELMAVDLDVQRNVSQQLVSAISRVADSLPGLGIVAAVLGVVVTMQAIEGPAAQIGHKVAAALVGTFLGILLCYGVVGPVASHLSARNRARAEYLHVLRAGLVAFQKGASPVVAAEYSRRSIPSDLRPSFDAMEYELRRNTRVPETSEVEATH